MTGFVVFLVIVYLIVLTSRVNKVERLLNPFKQPPIQSRPTEVKTASVSVAASSTLAATPPPFTEFSKPLEPKEKIGEDEILSGWLTKIGLVALLFGMGFFLKFAIDQGWINEQARVIIGLIVGGLFMALGEMWKEKFPKYANSLTGGGAAILYFSIFAAYQFYSLIGQSAAFFIMILITALTAFLSYRYRSVPLALLAEVGGYFSPLFLYSGRDQQIPLFMYLTLLNFGLLIVLVKKIYFPLLFLGLIGTVLDYWLWAGSFSSSTNILPSVVFLVFNYALFFLIAALAFPKREEESPKPVSQLLSTSRDELTGLFFTLVGTFFAASLIELLYVDYREYLTFVLLVQALLALAVYGSLAKTNLSAGKYVVAGLAGFLLVLAEIWKFTGHTQKIYILATGLLGLGAGAYWRQVQLRVAGVVILIVGALKILFTDYDIQNYRFFFNGKFLMTLLAVLIFWLAARIYKSFETEVYEKGISNGLKVTALLVTWFAFSWEIVQYFRGSISSNAGNLTLSIWWIAYAVAVLIYGAMVKEAIFRKLAVVLLALSILKVFLYDVQALATGYRVVSFIVLGVILLSISYTYQRNKEKVNKFLAGEE